jgi:hypothetical protein
MRDLLQRADAAKLLELLERCLEADAHIERYVQLALTLEGLLDAFGQKMKG